MRAGGQGQMTRAWEGLSLCGAHGSLTSERQTFFKAVPRSRAHPVRIGVPSPAVAEGAQRVTCRRQACLWDRRMSARESKFIPFSPAICL